MAYAQGGPTNHIVAVTPHDSTDFLSGTVCEYLRVGTGGNVVVVFKDGTTHQFNNVQAGERLEARCVRVNSTLTTASDISAFFQPLPDSGV